MNEIITSVENLEKEAMTMQSYLEVTMSDNPQEWTERGNTLCEYMARSGKCLADAKFHLAEKKKSFIIKDLTDLLVKAGLSATAQNNLISSSCGDMERLVTWFDRLNRTCTHQMDYIRSLISREKAEMQFNGMRENVPSDANWLKKLN